VAKTLTSVIRFSPDIKSGTSMLKEPAPTVSPLGR